MIKIKLTLIIMFISAFAAGVSTGRVLDRSARPMVPPPFMLNELNLTPDQQEKAHSIWADVLKQREPYHRDREALRNERDSEIRTLLNDEQKARFVEIQNKYTAKQDALTQAWRKLEDDAVEQTKSMLNEVQRKKFDVMLDERAEIRKREKVDKSNADPRLPGN